MSKIDLVHQAWGTHPVFLRSTASRSVFTAREVLIGTFEVNASQKSLASQQEVTQDTQVSQEKPRKSHKSQKTSKSTTNKASNLGLNMVIAAAILIGTTLFAPSVYYAFFPVPVKQVMAQENGSALGGDFDLGAAIPVSEQTTPEKTVDENGAEVIAIDAYMPPIDDSLPEGDWLVIPKIGVKSELQTTPDYRDALDTGLWMAPDFGRPGDTEVPTIIAGHRYGWDWWWKDDYWKLNSFNLLPDLEPGDTFEVITGKRKWVYEIYAGEEGAQISDYDADVILYTCKYLTGPARHFRYARLVNPNL